MSIYRKRQKSVISQQLSILKKGNKGYTLCVRFGVLLFPFVTLPVRVR